MIQQNLQLAPSAVWRKNNKTKLRRAIADWVELSVFLYIGRPEADSQVSVLKFEQHELFIHYIILWFLKMFQQTRGDVDSGSEFSYKSCLSPPAPPVLAPQPKLRRISSSTLSLSGRTKKKILTVRFMTFPNFSNLNYVWFICGYKRTYLYYIHILNRYSFSMRNCDISSYFFDIYF